MDYSLYPVTFTAFLREFSKLALMKYFWAPSVPEWALNLIAQIPVLALREPCSIAVALLGLLANLKERDTLADGVLETFKII